MWILLSWYDSFWCDNAEVFFSLGHVWQIISEGVERVIIPKGKLGNIGESRQTVYDYLYYSFNSSIGLNVFKIKRVWGKVLKANEDML